MPCERIGTGSPLRGRPPSKQRSPTLGSSLTVTVTQSRSTAAGPGCWSPGPSGAAAAVCWGLTGTVTTDSDHVLPPGTDSDHVRPGPGGRRGLPHQCTASGSVALPGRPGRRWLAAWQTRASDRH